MGVDGTFLREFMYILTGFEESVADSCGVLSHSAKMPDLDFFSLVIFEGMVTNRKAKKEEMEGRYRAMPRQTFQTFHSSQKWIKLIKFV